MGRLGLDGEIGGRGEGGMQELNLRSLPAAPYGVSNAILPPPSSVENIVAPTQATTPDSS